MLSIAIMHINFVANVQSADKGVTDVYFDVHLLFFLFFCYSIRWPVCVGFVLVGPLCMFRTLEGSASVYGEEGGAKYGILYRQNIACGDRVGDSASVFTECMREANK